MEAAVFAVVVADEMTFIQMVDDGLCDHREDHLRDIK
jgi:hypothetical protein